MPVSALVAVDASPATREVQTGTERYCAEVCRRLEAAAPDLRFVFYASRPAPGPGFDATVLPAPRLWSQLRLPLELWGHRPDLLFVPAHAVPYLAPGRATTVVHDLAFERHPEAYAPAERTYLRLTTRWATRRCRLLCSVSEATRRDLVELYGVDPERITVVQPGLSPAPPAPAGDEVRTRLAALGVDRPYALHVGRVEARKNQATALEAVERLPDLLLVAAGPIRDEGLAARLRASPRARVLGRVPAADLEALYRGARALIFPSLYEGFGFPVLEAQLRGLPVVTARVSSLPEVGGDAAEYADDPYDEEELAAALERALNSSPALIERGYANAASFSWDRTATGVADLLRRAMA